jgi:hypothetical protein
MWNRRKLASLSAPVWLLTFFFRKNYADKAHMYTHFTGNPAFASGVGPVAGIERMTRGNQRIEAQKKAEKKKVHARILYCSIVL